MSFLFRAVELSLSFIYKQDSSVSSFISQMPRKANSDKFGDEEAMTGEDPLECTSTSKLGSSKQNKNNWLLRINQDHEPRSWALGTQEDLPVPPKGKLVTGGSRGPCCCYLALMLGLHKILSLLWTPRVSTILSKEKNTNSLKLLKRFILISVCVTHLEHMAPAGPENMCPDYCGTVWSYTFVQTGISNQSLSHYVEGLYLFCLKWQDVLKCVLVRYTWT